MAERRMFAKTIIDSDSFLDMPLSTQALYFHLSMRADDDGFINNAKKIAKMIGGTEDELKLLIAKRFIIPFESGVVVIKHWKIHNYIQNDRYKPTLYTDEKSRLSIKPNKAYSEQCIQDVSKMETQVRLGKVRLGEVSLEGDTEELPTLEQIKEFHSLKKMTFDVMKFYNYYSEGKWLDSHGNKVTNWKQKMITWQNKEKPSTTKKQYTVEKEQKYTEEELEEMLLNKRGGND
jgi:hypothetical protein